MEELPPENPPPTEAISPPQEVSFSATSTAAQQPAPPMPISTQPLAQIPPREPLAPHNFTLRQHPTRALLFLIPAVLLIATIYLVAKFTGNSYTMREPAPLPTLSVLPTATPIPTPTLAPTKTYKNEDLLVQMSIPEGYDVLSEDEKTISLGKAGREILLVSRQRDTDYQDEETEEVTVGGKKAVKFSNIIYLTEEPNYQLSVFAENKAEEAEVQKIIDSIIFLVDTSDWETFENTTFNYQIKYPSGWTLSAPEKDGEFSEKTEISKNPSDKTVNNLVIQSSSGLQNAAFTASEIVSSTRTLSGWNGSPKIELKKLGGGDAQVISGELSGKWRVYVVIWYKNTVIQMTWDDATTKGDQQIFDNILASFEFTN